ncbi:MAG: peptidyl-dipeptidase Dcp, partial [Candidatus Pseudothioglobus sp.]
MNVMVNPFFKSWQTSYGMPPFDEIKDEHYLPAFERAFADHEAEIDQIAANKSPPTFTNTIEAMERSGA